jgi:ABC-2 type transport system permease protein
VFAGAGIFASASTDNQVIAFLLGISYCFVLFAGISALAQISLWGAAQYYLVQLGLDYHYEALGRGVIDSRNVLYMSSLVVFFLWLTAQRVARR